MRVAADVGGIVTDILSTLPSGEITDGFHPAAGGSGHCFRLGLAIGELVAGGIVRAPASCADIHDFSLGRFAGNGAFEPTYGGNRS